MVVMTNDLTCFVCGVAGAPHFLHTKPRKTGAYFTFLANHIPPNNAKLPSDDGRVSCCIICKAFLTEQWKSYEKRKTPMVERLFWMKRTDDKMFTGAEMSVQKEYIAQVIGLNNNTNNSSFYGSSQINGISSRNTVEHNGNSPASDIPGANVLLNQSADDNDDNVEALDLSTSPNKNQITNCRKISKRKSNEQHKTECNISNGHETNYSSVKKLKASSESSNNFVCYICRLAYSDHHSRFVSCAERSDEPYFPFIKHLEKPEKAKDMTKSGLVEVCCECRKKLSRQWKVYEARRIPMNQRLYSNICNSDIKPSSVIPDVWKNENSSEPLEECFFCTHRQVSVDNIHPLCLPFIKSLLPESHLYLSGLAHLEKLYKLITTVSSPSIKSCRACNDLLAREIMIFVQSKKQSKPTEKTITDVYYNAIDGPNKCNKLKINNGSNLRDLYCENLVEPKLEPNTYHLVECISNNNNNNNKSNMDNNQLQSTTNLTDVNEINYYHNNEAGNVKKFKEKNAKKDDDGDDVKPASYETEDNVHVLDAHASEFKNVGKADLMTSILSSSSSSSSSLPSSSSSSSSKYQSTISDASENVPYLPVPPSMTSPSLASSPGLKTSSRDADTDHSICNNESNNNNNNVSINYIEDVNYNKINSINSIVNNNNNIINSNSITNNNNNINKNIINNNSLLRNEFSIWKTLGTAGGGTNNSYTSSSSSTSCSSSSTSSSSTPLSLTSAIWSSHHHHHHHHHHNTLRDENNNDRKTCNINVNECTNNNNNNNNNKNNNNNNDVITHNNVNGNNYINYPTIYFSTKDNNMMNGYAANETIQSNNDIHSSNNNNNNNINYYCCHNNYNNNRNISHDNGNVANFIDKNINNNNIITNQNIYTTTCNINNNNISQNENNNATTTTTIDHCTDAMYCAALGLISLHHSKEHPPPSSSSSSSSPSSLSSSSSSFLSSQLISTSVSTSQLMIPSSSSSSSPHLFFSSSSSPNKMNPHTIKINSMETTNSIETTNNIETTNSIDIINNIDNIPNRSAWPGVDVIRQAYINHLKIQMKEEKLLKAKQADVMQEHQKLLQRHLKLSALKQTAQDELTTTEAEKATLLSELHQLNEHLTKIKSSEITYYINQI